MAVLALRVTAHNGLTTKQRRALAVCAEFVDLGEGALYEATAAPRHEWLIFADGRFDLEAAALIAHVFKWPQRSPDPAGLSRVDLRGAIKAEYSWSVPAVPVGEDPYTYVADQNANNPQLAMWTSLPVGFEPKQ